MFIFNSKFLWLLKVIIFIISTVIAGTCLFVAYHFIEHIPVNMLMTGWVSCSIYFATSKFLHVILVLEE